VVRGIHQDIREGAERASAQVKEDKPPARPRPRWRGWVSWGVIGALGIRLVVVDGISMEPAYKRGDVAIGHEGQTRRRCR
jgi:hypothetical protein